MTQTKWGRKDWFQLTTLGHTPSSKEVRKGTQAGIDAEAMEERYFLACSSWQAQFAFLYYPGPPGVTAPTVAGLSHINH